ncbi:MAG: metallophosphoesterase [Deltaproteobacteria bacterium]|nr:metallophosphoesterase [Deltaproteobacteria bacterium]
MLRRRGWLLLLSLLAAPVRAEVPARPEPVPPGSWPARLLQPQSYLRPLRAARRTLEAQGGLLRLRPDLLTILVPDLHGRRDYLDAVLRTRDPELGQSYRALLAQGRVQLVCLGDVMHSEHRGSLWRRGMPDEAMALEMGESLGTLTRVANLQHRYPGLVHLLRGNHDDVGPLAPVAGQNLPLQVRRTREFLGARFGEAFVGELARFFAALPIAASGPGFVLAHSAPMFSIGRDEVERRAERATVSLTRARMPSFDQLRRQSQGPADAAAGLERALGELGLGGPAQLFIHGHLWASPLEVRGREVWFGHLEDQTFLRLDPRRPLEPWNQLHEAGSGKRVPVPVPAP